MTALWDVSFEVPAGHKVAVVGPSEHPDADVDYYRIDVAQAQIVHDALDHHGIDEVGTHVELTAGTGPLHDLLGRARHEGADPGHVLVPQDAPEFLNTCGVLVSFEAQQEATV